MAYLDFLSSLHKQTKRDYLARVNDPEFPKARAAELARAWAKDYWDGDRRTGYGGYSYDGRWRPVAQALAEHYNLKSGDHLLDVGCGKAFLLYELTQVVPGLKVCGLDISAYALQNAKQELRGSYVQGNATELPFRDQQFKLTLSLTTLHNLRSYQLEAALHEIQRVSQQAYIVVESFRNLQEWENLLYWQLTCECFFWPDEWQWWFDKTGYQGDHSFIYFE